MTFYLRCERWKLKVHNPGGEATKTNLFEVDLCVCAHTHVPNQVYDPFLTLLLGEVEPCREVAVENVRMDEKGGMAWDVLDINLLVNATVRFADEVPRIVHKVLPEVAEEEIVLHHPLRNGQAPLRSLEIKIDIEIFEELCDRVLVLILLCLYHAHDIPDGVTCAGRRRIGSLARYNSSPSQVAQDPWGGGLDRVQVCGGEERFEEERAALWVVEVDK